MIDVSSITTSLYELIDNIKKEEVYLKLKNSYDNLLKDESLKSLIEKFNQKKEIYSKYKDEKTKEEIINIRKELYSSSLYKEYDECLNEYNSFIKTIEDRINDAIFSENLKTLLKLR